MDNPPRPFPAPTALRLVAGLAMGCAIGLGVTSRGVAQTALPASSPFMSATGPAAASAPGEVIEFAAVRTIGKRTEIDLYDTQGKKNHWIQVGGTADGMTVVSYDAHRDQVTATIGGVNKLLTLRQTKGVAAGNAAVTAAPAMNFALPTPPPLPQVASAPANTAPAAEASASATPTAPVTTATPAATPGQPAAPLSIARQEEEARMLVSDLLEIGMAQRKAYEEKQRKAADPNAAATPEPSAPATKPDGG